MLFYGSDCVKSVDDTLAKAGYIARANEGRHCHMAQTGVSLLHGKAIDPVHLSFKKLFYSYF